MKQAVPLVVVSGTLGIVPEYQPDALVLQCYIATALVGISVPPEPTNLTHCGPEAK